MLLVQASINSVKCLLLAWNIAPVTIARLNNTHDGPVDCIPLVVLCIKMDTARCFCMLAVASSPNYEIGAHITSRGPWSKFMLYVEISHSHTAMSSIQRMPCLQQTQSVVYPDLTSKHLKYVCLLLGLPQAFATCHQQQQGQISQISGRSKSGSQMYVRHAVDFAPLQLCC